MSIDTERLIKDLRGAARVLLDGDDYHTSGKQQGMCSAWLILASAIEDGEYNLEPSTRTIAEVDPDWDLPENVFPIEEDR